MKDGDFSCYGIEVMIALAVLTEPWTLSACVLKEL